MSTVNYIENSEFNGNNFIKPVDAKKQEQNAQAELARMLTLIEDLREAISNPGSSAPKGKITPFRSESNGTPSSAPNNNPSNAEIEAMMGQLMAEIAVFQVLDQSKDKERIAVQNSKIASAYLQEMKTQMNDTIADIKKNLKEEEDQTWWQEFEKALEGIFGYLGAILAAATGNPILAAVLFTMTTLAVSPLMGMITKAITDDISSDLQKNEHYTKTEADKIAGIITSVMTVVVMAAAAAGGSLYSVYGAVEAVAEESIEMVDMSAGAVNSAAEGADETASTIGEQIQTVLSKITRFCSRTPFAKPAAAALPFVLLAGGAGAATGQGMTAWVDSELAKTTIEQGQEQAFLSSLQADVNATREEAANNTKATSDALKTWGKILVNLSKTLVAPQEDVSRALQA